MAWVIAGLGLALLAGIHELARRLAARKWRHAIAITLAGVAHYVAIAVVAFAFCMSYGVATGAYTTHVRETVEGYDSFGKLKPGDLVVAVDHVPLVEPELALRVNRRNGEPVVLTIERGGARQDITLDPTRDSNGRWLIGVRPSYEPVVDRALGRAVGKALWMPIDAVREFARTTDDLIEGREQVDIGGPVRILDEYVVELPLWRIALTLLLRVAVTALLVQLVLDMIRSRRT